MDGIPRRFRSVIYIIIAVVALIMEIVFSKIWGGIGCALAIAGALLLGQGLIMNIYYKKKQHLDIRGFWVEIMKISVAPLVLTLLFFVIIHYLVPIDSWKSLCIYIIAFSAFLLPLLYIFSMNEYERTMVKQILNRFKK